MNSKRLREAIAGIVAICVGAGAAGAEGWSASLVYGSTSGLSSKEVLGYLRPLQSEVQRFDAESGALLAGAEWQFSRHLGLAIEYLNGGGTSVVQQIQATAYTVDPNQPRRTLILDSGPIRSDLPIDQRFGSLGLVIHFIQLGRVEITPRILLSRSFGLPGSSEIRLASVGVPAQFVLDDIPFGEHLESFVREYRLDSTDDLGWALGLDATVSLGWRRWQDRNSLNLVLSARRFQFDPIEASAPEVSIASPGADAVLLPRSRFRMELEPVFLGAGLHYRF